MDGQRDERPDPELLLKQNFPRESDKARGRLKIFFGYAAGVGKTYAMLEAARQEKAAGRDVVAGYIEPHDRPDTMELLAGMELLTPMAVRFTTKTRRTRRLSAFLQWKTCLPCVK